MNFFLAAKVRIRGKIENANIFIFFIVLETNSYSVENKDGRCGLQR